MHLPHFQGQCRTTIDRSLLLVTRVILPPQKIKPPQITKHRIQLLQTQNTDKQT